MYSSREPATSLGQRKLSCRLTAHFRQLARVGALSAFVVGNAHAQPALNIPVNIGFPTPVIDVFNYQLNASRLFPAESNTTKVVLSAFVFPSPDTDVSPFVSPFDGKRYLSNNGYATAVSFSHPALSAEPLALPFSGLSSGRGGASNSYTSWLLDRSDATAGPTLDALASVPIQVTIKNPLAPSGVTSLTYTAPPYIKGALPGFATDVSLTGSEGLSPTLRWKLPPGIGDSNGVASPYYFTPSVRLYQFDVDAANGNISKVNLVHVSFLNPGATSYTFDQVFSSSSQSGFPIGLEAGKNYAAVVQVGQYRLGRLNEWVPGPNSPGDLNSDGSYDLVGVSDYSVEFRTRSIPTDPVPGAPAVFLPSVGPDGVFRFDVSVVAGEQILIDPDVAIGYDYQIGIGDPLFKSVSLPAIGDGLFDLYLFNGTSYSFASVLTAGTEYLFAGLGVDRFRVLGIETSAGIDPTDTTAFVTALTFAADGRFTGTQTPLTQEVLAVPEPEAHALLLVGLALVGIAAHRNRPTAAQPCATI